MATKVVDGDTFHFQRGAELVKVRVAGFDAPERGQPFGRVATAKLSALVLGGADCDCYKTDRYRRSVCRVRANGLNVATTMLKAGLGCIDPRFAGEDDLIDRFAHRRALDEAQLEKRGMWAVPGAVCAKEYRESRRANR